MNSSNFDHLENMASDLKDEILDLTGNDPDDDLDVDLTGTVNEYGESVDDELVDDTLNTQDKTIAVRDTLTKQSTPTSHPSWLKRSYLAVNETDREFELFKVYCVYGGGRSLHYIQNVSNYTITAINKIATKNNWKRRVEDYDRMQLVQRMKEAQTSRHELHVRKLESYREEQEALGKQLTLNAARIALIANSTLCKMLEEEKELDARDLPSMLNVAAKLADVGKNLQSSSLGVDNLLAALEEADGE